MHCYDREAANASEQIYECIFFLHLIYAKDCGAKLKL